MLNIVKRNGEVRIQPIALATFLEQQRRYDRDVESYMSARYHKQLTEEEMLDMYRMELPDNCYWVGLKVDRVIRQIPTDPIVFNNMSPIHAVDGYHGTLQHMRAFSSVVEAYPDRVFLIRGFSRRWSEMNLFAEFRIVSKSALTPVLRNYKLRSIK